MDLLGDLGAADQLESARSENAVLKARVKEIQARCSVLNVENETLKIENESLKAEVEMYREEARASGTGGSYANTGSVDNNDEQDVFVKSGNGIYPSVCDTTMSMIHEIANVLCCTLSPDDSIVATGGADGTLALSQWGESDSDPVMASCGAPVISVAFAKTRFPFLAAGCMDGSVHLIRYKAKSSSFEMESTVIASASIKHTKYVKNVIWSPSQPILVSSSADGCVQVHKIEWSAFDDDENNVSLEKVRMLQLTGPVESTCFVENKLFCYARGTPHLAYFDLDDDFAQTKINLNKGPGNAGFDDHVSFAVMAMSVDSSNKFLALATDTSRNIIVEWSTGRQVRNLYGHKNDGFSQPKLAWSQNGQYLIGNSQEDPTMFVWDVASSSVVKKLEGHTNPVRDIFCSRTTETMVTTSFDKKTMIWLSPGSD